MPAAQARRLSSLALDCMGKSARTFCDAHCSTPTHLATMDADMQVNDGPCVMYIGDGGSGNYVKMVHNGIEYGDMQVGGHSKGLHRLAHCTCCPFLSCHVVISYTRFTSVSLPVSRVHAAVALPCTEKLVGSWLVPYLQALQSKHGKRICCQSCLPTFSSSLRRMTS
jgi:hypothetical protein